MAWLLRQRRKARGYSDTADRLAFTQGYRDGYANRPREPHGHPVNAYSAGYWEGNGDRDL